MLKNMKMRRDYFIINIDGPYAREIYEVLKRGQAAKGEWPEGDISFEEWKRQIFEEEGQGWQNIVKNQLLLMQKFTGAAWRMA